MSNSINWMDGKPMGPGTGRQASRLPGAGPMVSAGEYAAPYSQTQYSPTQYSSQAVPAQFTPSQFTAQTAPTPMAPTQQSDLLSAGPAAFQQGPPLATERGFIPYYLTQNIGKSVRAEFIIGSNQYIDKSGILIEVGINYFVLQDVGSRTHVMCDLYSVKFVTILEPSLG
jgi:hypothetical protein